MSITDMPFSAVTVLTLLPVIRSKRLGGRPSASHNDAVSRTRKDHATARGDAATVGVDGAARSQRRADMVRLAGELFAEKGFRATTVREIADAAGILSGSLYHHFDSKESIGDEILSGFLDDVLADYRAGVAATDDPREALEMIVRSSSHTLERHAAALTMLQNDWNYFSTQPRFAYLRKDLREIERIWIAQLERGKEGGIFRADLDVRLTYRLLRDILWLPVNWRKASGLTTDEVVDAFLQLLFDGIAARSS